MVPELVFWEEVAGGGGCITRFDREKVGGKREGIGLGIILFQMETRMHAFSIIWPNDY